MLLRAAPLALAVLALAACGGGKSAQTTTQHSLLPPGCSAQQVQGIVTDFLAHPSLAPAGFFTSYRTQESDGRVFSTRNRADALAHVKARLDIGERARLLQLQVFPIDVNHVHIAFTLTRTAPDFARRGIHFRISNGTGTVDCAHGKVASWSQKGP